METKRHFLGNNELGWKTVNEEESIMQQIILVIVLLLSDTQCETILTIKPNKKGNLVC